MSDSGTREVLSRLENLLVRDKHNIQTLVKSEQMLDGVCAVDLNKFHTILRCCLQNLMIA